MKNYKIHTVDEIRLLYNTSPATLRKGLNVHDKIFTDDYWISKLEGILRTCKVSYGLKTHEITGGSYEITIGQNTH